MLDTVLDQLRYASSFFRYRLYVYEADDGEVSYWIDERELVVFWKTIAWTTNHESAVKHLQWLRKWF